MVIRYVTDDLKISSNDSDGEQIKIKCRNNAFFESASLIMTF